MTNSLSRIDHWLAKRRPDYYRGLRPGATVAVLDAVEQRLGLSLPTAFRELYAWRNGQAVANTASLYGNRMFLALDEIVETKELLDDLIDSDFDDPRYWRRGWVPFLHNGGGSYLCVDLKAEDGGSPGQILAFWKADQDRPIKHPNLESWLDALASALEKVESADQVKFYS